MCQCSPCTSATLAQCPPSQQLYSCVAVLLDTLRCSMSSSCWLTCRRHAGCLASIHSHFPLLESLMVSKASESTSPGGCCSCTFCYSHHRISSLTEWGLVLLVAKSVLTDASPHAGFSIHLASLCQYALQQQLPSILPWQRIGAKPHRSMGEWVNRPGLKDWGVISWLGKSLLV